MFNIIFSDEYDAASRLIAEWRRSAGLGQRELAAGLDRTQGHIQRMETRQRPIDVVEFCRIASLTGLSPRDAIDQLLNAWERAGVTLPAAIGGVGGPGLTLAVSEHPPRSGV